MTEDHKRKIGDALRGRKLSDETKAKMRGREVSLETRQRISAALKGRRHATRAHDRVDAVESVGDVRLIPYLLVGGAACLLLHSQSGVFTRKQFMYKAGQSFDDALRLIALVKREDYNPDTPHRRAIRANHKWEIFKRDGYHCRRCGSDFDLTIDHIVPVTAGGKNTMSNYQTLCRSCNSKKGAKR